MLFIVFMLLFSCVYLFDIYIYNILAKCGGDMYKYTQWTIWDALLCQVAAAVAALLSVRSRRKQHNKAATVIPKHWGNRR